MQLKSINAAGHPIWDWPGYNEFLVEFKSLNCTSLSEFDKLPTMPGHRAIETHYGKRWTEIKKDAGFDFMPNMLDDTALIQLIKTAFDEDGASISTLQSHHLTAQYLAKRFGNLNSVYDLAGYKLKTRSTSSKSDSELLSDYLELSNRLGKPATVVDVNSSALTNNFSIYEAHFGSMNNVRKLTGLPLDQRALKKYTRSELITALKIAFDDDPDIKYADLKANLKLQHISISTLKRYFGNVTKNSLYTLTKYKN
ncbi:hypothetical protein RIU76_06855 [Latilactobacillus sakei subsp. sakei]|uniref:hypothetical protein n=1 Tax=Latilactobacillus sakei TaxID=1599 RepID=UPI002861F917|nr:hypothetical protein [Latilactobacillus sakei]MDR7924443.1 hypothetical protein [Latilactobacillus sakei subsp. sakei]